MIFAKFKGVSLDKLLDHRPRGMDIPSPELIDSLSWTVGILPAQGTLVEPLYGLEGYCLISAPGICRTVLKGTYDEVTHKLELALNGKKPRKTSEQFKAIEQALGGTNASWPTLRQRSTAMERIQSVLNDGGVAPEKGTSE